MRGTNGRACRLRFDESGTCASAEAFRPTHCDRPKGDDGALWCACPLAEVHVVGRWRRVFDLGVRLFGLCGLSPDFRRVQCGEYGLDRISVAAVACAVG